MIREEFSGIRAQLYERALTKYPNARKQDLEIMHQLLNPQEGDKILGIGEGNGFFCEEISKSIGNKGTYHITDPSKDQLINLIKKISSSKVSIQQIGAQEIDSEEEYDKVWSFGAFHHCKEQEKAMQKIHRALKKEGTLILCDVFQGSKLAKHFDGPVSGYCITGHDVNFLSEEYAKTLLIKTKFKKIKIIDLNIKWFFEKEEEIGEFIHDLHAMTLIGKNPYKKVLEGCKKILGVEKTKEGFALNWPMKALVAIK